jgi:hypothetical protein
MASFHDRNSFLRRAGVYDVFLDINQLPTTPRTTDDVRYTIDSKYDQRPDLLAYDLYGSTRLWWVFALRNPDLIEDPIRDFKQGLTIIAPTRGAVNQITG